MTCAVGRTFVWRSGQGVRVLVGTHEGEKLFGIPRRKWEESVKMGSDGMEWDGLDPSHVGQNRDK